MANASSTRPRAPGFLLLVVLALSGLAACTSGADAAPDALDAAEVAEDAPAPVDVSAPPGVARFPGALPFLVTRVSLEGEPPTGDEVAAFTTRMAGFYAAIDVFAWMRRVSHGLAEGNPWGQPPYLLWWQDVVAVRQGVQVTFRHTGGADNTMAWHGRVVGPVVGAYLTLPGAREPGPLRDLVLGYLRGVSATFTGSVWADEHPVVDTIMARAIFHRNHAWTLDGGRQAAVDYEAVRHEVLERRHDTLWNPANPTYGDVFVRTKRSKDDFPWIYRFPVHLSRLLWTTDDPEIRQAAHVLWNQLRAFAADIVDHGYVIRAKGPGGQVFVPYVEGTEIVDDFASLVSYEALVPNAECNAKLAVALIATGQALGNACDDGISETYERVALARYYGHTWMQWGFHLAAVAVALLYGDDAAAQGLLTGLGARMDDLMVRDDAISADPRYWSDVAQTLVQAATWGLPLTPAEARLVMREFAAAADHYQPWDRWDPWREGLPDGEGDVVPPRESGVDAAAKTHVWIPELLNLFEYCASPVRATTGAPILDCERFTSALGVAVPGVGRPATAR